MAAFAGNFGSPWQLLVLLVIVLLLFGGNRLRNLGGDIGGAIKGFKKAMSDGDQNKDTDKEPEKLNADSHKIIEGEAKKVETEKDKSGH
jgi:sec-independent protein translocase protein TatA